MQFEQLTAGHGALTAVRAGKVHPRDIALREPNWPPHLMQLQNAFLNQFEMPVLFYVVSIALYVTHHAGRAAVVMSWVYVGLRMLHSWEHLTTNHVRRRLAAFALSNFVLVAIWIRFLKSLF